MLLAVNVGNKDISFAVFDGISSEPKAKFSMASDIKKTSDEYAVTLSQLLGFSGVDVKDIDGAIMSSVVPFLNDVIKHVILVLTGKTPIIVGPGVKTGFAIRIDDPASLGADIVANAAAVVAYLKENKLECPAIILDMRAATTLFAINKQKELVGGTILAGADMSLDMLHKNTALLPSVEMSGVSRAIGKNTKESLVSGVIFGQAAMIDGLVDRFKKELKCEGGEILLFATGENCKPIIAHCTNEFRYEQNLTLGGLAYIYKNTVG